MSVWRLTLRNLLIIMAVSLVVSGLLFRLTLQELDEALRALDPVSEGPLDFLPGAIRDEVGEERQQLFENLRQRLLDAIIMINAAVLLVGLPVSYLMARLTVRQFEDRD